jgi:hypothetical protein
MPRPKYKPETRVETSRGEDKIEAVVQKSDGLWYQLAKRPGTEGPADLIREDEVTAAFRRMVPRAAGQSKRASKADKKDKGNHARA